MSQLAIKDGSSEFAVAIHRDQGKSAYIQIHNPLTVVPLFNISLSFPLFGMTYLHNSTTLACLSQDFELIRVSDSRETLRNGAVEKSRKSNFESMYGSIQIEAEVAEVVTKTDIDRDIMSFLDAPSHIIAGPSKMAEMFLSALLTPKVCSTEDIVGDIEMESSIEKKEVEQVLEPLQSYSFLDDLFKGLAMGQVPKRRASIVSR